MGIINQRPAVRAREQRIIRERLGYYAERAHHLEANGLDATAAARQAYAEASALKVGRDGHLILTDPKP